MKNQRLHELRRSDIFSRFQQMSYLPRWGVFLMDVALCTIAFWISVFVGGGFFDYGKLAGQITPLGYQYLIVLGVQMIFFWIFHTYSGIIRYSTFIDTVKILAATLGTGFILLTTNYVMAKTLNYHPLLNTVVVLYELISFTFLFILRVGVKTISEQIQRSSATPAVMIYGTQSAGVAIAKMLRSSENAPYRPVGFICEPDEKYGYDMAGLRIRPLNEKLFEWMAVHRVNHVIVSPLKMQAINPATDLQIFIDHNIHILTTPYFKQFDDVDTMDAERIGRIDAIKIEDLLERPKIEIDTENVRKIIKDKVVLVSGAAGSIGSELVRQVQKYDPQVTILLEMAESPLHDFTLELQKSFPDARFIPIIADVRNRARIEQIFSEMRPDVVYHAAAYKHVPLMEDFPGEAIRANVLGTKNMADMAVKYGTQRFVMISTDKAVNPTNVMGASKRIAEIYVQSLYNKLHAKDENCTKFITTRFGNVLGSNGSVIPYFRKQIAAGGPVTVTHPNIIRYFMTIPEACCLVMEASTLGNGGEIFVFDMGKPVKILDLARNMIRLAGYTPEKEIQIQFTGLRPGEKLYEELLNQKEATLPTSNEKIMVARVREFDYDVVSKQIDKLIATTTTTTTIRSNKSFTTVKLMKEIVPEFISNNSIYEQLDQQ
ncbi:MAG: polysaccharide biosynthesis protein [Paludibacteraceae bacterium]|nr:polysaccharide biosynthesis protein [Paludibacteraceae bacterium]